MKNFVVTLHNISKIYTKFHLFNISRFKALEGINLKIQKGEVLGLIGANGAGKSTLLKLIAGTSKPTTGTLEISGKVLAILNISTGLCDEKTGIENLAHVTTLYGVDAHTLKSIESEIIEFADLGEFIYSPVRTYSSGMRLRLAFSILTHLPFDILLIDEALSVGDANFSLKCRQRIRNLCSKNKTVIIVSHGMTAIKELCDRVIWLENGKIKLIDDPQYTTENYRASLIKNLDDQLKNKFAHRQIKNQKNSPFSILDFKLQDGVSHKLLKVFELGSTLKFMADFEILKNTTLNLEMSIIRSDGVLIFKDKKRELFKEGSYQVEYVFPEISIGRFLYEATFKITNENESREATTIFSIYDDFYAYNSSYYPKITWEQIS